MISRWSLTYWSVVTGVMYRCESGWLGNTPHNVHEHQPASRGGQRILRWITVNVQEVGRIGRTARVHHVERVFADASRHDGADRDTGPSDGLQAILPVANAALVVEFDSFTSQVPLAALDCTVFSN
jgi:hypothetical protein